MSSLSARRLASIHPDLAAAYLTISQDFAREFPGSHLSVAQGYRTPSQQATAASLGRSAANGTTTFSKHQRYPSLALDFAVLDPGGNYVADGQDPRYRWVAEQFEQAGFKWGGRWTTPDWDHVEAAEGVAGGVLVDYETYRKTTTDAPFLKLI